MKTLDVAIIGGGPAGMAAAVKLKKLGVEKVLLFERNSFLGGILQQCIHPGFGLEYFNKELTGPEFALRFIEEVESLKIPYQLNSMVIDLQEHELTVSSKKNGIEKYKAKTIIFATGCRERTRENLEIPGTRPAGIYPAGLAQTLINLHGYRIGKKVIIQGSGDIGLIMARRLIIEGYEVVAVLERLPYLSGLIRNKVQCLDHFNIPLQLSTEITEICGQDRVNGVYIASTDNKEQRTFIECDTALFSVGLIPELELARKIGTKISNNFNPNVNCKFESNIPGIFFSGNCLHINDLADTAAIEGEKAAEAAFQYLNDRIEFLNSTTQSKPYEEMQKDETYDSNFFQDLKNSGEKICIICPKSCRISEKNYGCKRGKDYLNVSKESDKQRFTTMFSPPNSKRLPIISHTELPVNNFRKIKRTLMNTVPALNNKNHITIKFKDKTISFSKPH